MDSNNNNQPNPPLTKKQRREIKRQENFQQTGKAERMKNMRRWMMILIILVVVGGIGYLIYSSSQAEPASQQSSSNPFLGGADAAVVITEFSDLSCPACAAAVPILKQVMEAYGDQVKFVFNSFSIQHRWSDKALEAGECAFAQNKFWEFHDLVFSTQSDWENANDAIDKFKNYAEQVGADKNAFSTCLDSGSMKQEVNTDTAYGQSKRVSATPTFYINDEKLVGVQSFDEFKKIIDPLLTAAGVYPNSANANSAETPANLDPTNQ